MEDIQYFILILPSIRKKYIVGKMSVIKYQLIFNEKGDDYKYG